MLEDEGRIIGSNNLPLPLFNGMQQAPVAVIDDPFDIRPARLQAEYIDGMREQFEQAYGVEEGWRQYDDYLHHGLFAIRRRLGTERFQQLTQRLEAALRAQRLSGGRRAPRMVGASVAAVLRSDVLLSVGKKPSGSSSVGTMQK